MTTLLMRLCAKSQPLTSIQPDAFESVLSASVPLPDGEASLVLEPLFAAPEPLVMLARDGAVGGAFASSFAMRSAFSLSVA